MRKIGMMRELFGLQAMSQRVEDGEEMMEINCKMFFLFFVFGVDGRGWECY